MAVTLTHLQRPEQPEVHLETASTSPEVAAEAIVERLRSSGTIS